MSKTKSKFIVRPSDLGACVALSDDVMAGALLSRIIVRHQKFKTLSDPTGLTAVVLTRNEWMTDTGFSRHQYDRALGILKKRKLIVISHRKVRKTDQYQRTWINVPPETLSAMTRIMYPTVLSVETDSDALQPSDKTDMDNQPISANPDDKENANYKKGNAELTENINYLKKETPVQVPGVLKQNEKKEEEKKDSKEDTDKAIEEGKQDALQEGHEESAQFDYKDFPKSVGTPFISDEYLADKISRIFAMINVFNPEMMPKQIKAVRECILELEKADCPLVMDGQEMTPEKELPTYGLMALVIVLVHWPDFREFLRIGNGAWNIPIKPNLVYFKLHIGCAVDFIKFIYWVSVQCPDHAFHHQFGTGQGNACNEDLIFAFYDGAVVSMKK